ncbi:MAG: efflux RND transporter permease subunit, partial [Acidobacteria bacterium]|nr:efflux RND transporter permease subunit [Acidobacteriota bacterium]
EAQRIQRGRDDVRVMVRYPRDERRSLGDLENMRIRTPSGGEVPFSVVAQVESGFGFASITRVDRNRSVNVTAAVDPATASAGSVISDLRERVLPEVLAEYPGVFFSFQGVQAEQAETLASLRRGFLLAMLLIYMLLAIPLRSYVQPLIIMAAVPFGAVGAIWGHLLMGLDLSILSVFGLVALTGVVVNDSLVMVDFINGARRDAPEETEADGLQRALLEAGTVRFRPILLTSLTTFVGLAPLMLERSTAAMTLVPMAVSLAFGVLFATFITLVLVPAIYLILADSQYVLQRAFGR